MDGRIREPAPVAAGRGRNALGTLCREAQADGVPCTELGRECEVCARAVAAAEADEAARTARAARAATPAQSPAADALPTHGGSETADDAPWGV